VTENDAVIDSIVKKAVRRVPSLDLDEIVDEALWGVLGHRVSDTMTRREAKLYVLRALARIFMPPAPSEPQP
jgi:hypothetical protein